MVYVTDGCLSGLFLLLHLFSSLVSLPCHRGHREGELGRSRLPLPLPVLLMSWLGIARHSFGALSFGHILSTVFRHYVFTFVSVLWFPSAGSCICCPVVSSVKVSILPACVGRKFVLLDSMLVAQGKCGLQVFRIRQFLSAHTFQYVIVGSSFHRSQNVVPLCIESLNVVSPESDAHKVRDFLFLRQTAYVTVSQRARSELQDIHSPAPMVDITIKISTKGNCEMCEMCEMCKVTKAQRKDTAQGRQQFVGATRKSDVAGCKKGATERERA